jgi:phosphoadenosine phosphosulfate reductase
MGAEDQVILDMISRLELDIPVFTLDTGRIFNETYELIAASEKKYGKKIKVFSPKSENVEKMVSEHGVNLFFQSVELRKECCRVRKLEPLARALKPYSAWICGLRREQAVTRSDTGVIELDAKGRIKINPLVNWSEQDVWDYIHKYDVPYNKLHDQGFLSIGCASCTRAVAPGEHTRAGRWWWETPEQKECGLHFKNGKLVRAKNKDI